MIELDMKCTPVLDPGFVPAVLWNREYRKQAQATDQARSVAIAVERPGGSLSRIDSVIFPDEPEYRAMNLVHVERLVKALLWMKGGKRIFIGGAPELAAMLGKAYSSSGERAFDDELIGRKVYGESLQVVACAYDQVPAERVSEKALGRNFSGCRIGFDLGGSDRKCAAVIDGDVVFSEEIAWDPYFQKDPKWHRDGINDSLRRAAAKLPRVDAIGGSAAGVYVDNQARIASLFRGVSEDDFEKYVRNIFLDLREEWNVPFEVINDGEVTALAGAISLNDDALLGVSMGTSLAVGYVNPDGKITDWLNELAFAPVDYRASGPVDEWSGDEGCGVQYFSQQGVARLAPLAGIDYPDDMPFAERLKDVQALMTNGDERAERIYRTVGTCFGYAIAHYREFYEFRNLMILGRVTSGAGGEMIIENAKEVLAAEFPELAESIRFTIPDEKMKRHGQAVAAASLPALQPKECWI